MAIPQTGKNQQVQTSALLDYLVNYFDISSPLTLSAKPRPTLDHDLSRNGFHGLNSCGNYFIILIVG